MFRIDCFNHLPLFWGAFVLSVSMALWTPVDLLAQEQENALDQELSQRWTNSIQPLLKEHCGSCHMDSANEGGVDLDDYQDLAKIRLHTSTWEQVRGVIRAEAMPPPEESRISTEQRLQLATWIEQALHEVDCSCAEPPPAVTLRRLNQIEYDNTVRDLLLVDLKASRKIGFVSDDVGNGFDNQGEVLTLPPIVLEKYLQAAEFVANNTIETDREQFRKQTFEGEALFHLGAQAIPIYTADGEYQINVRMRFGEKPNFTCQVAIAVDGKPVAQHDVQSKEETYKHDVNLTAGEHEVTVQYLQDNNPDDRNDPNSRLFIDTVRVSGPSNGQPAFPRHHDLLVIARPDQRDTPDSEPIGLPEASRRIFTKLLQRAYRRPVQAEEVNAVVAVCEKAAAAGFTYEESLRFGLQAVLVSPNFLFRNESLDTSSRIDDYSLAVRLSYFLWSSMPDETLFELARTGSLRDPEILKQQVDRMLDSPKSDAMVSGFFGQWLGLRNLAKIDIDREKYVGWNDRLRNALVKETEMFCGHLLRNGSLDEIVSANYTFINPRLAEFYGIPFEGNDPSKMYRRNPNRKGGNERRQGFYENEDKWVRSEQGMNRRGLLTHASVLALTSNPTRTSPVKRGKWILENVLGDPPPSAPPNVPSLESAEHKPNASLRERLEIHRSNPSCAGCHKLMDPIGLGLENFDAIGRWRDKDGEITIDSKGELADGRVFQSPAELIAFMSSAQPQVEKNVAQRMLTYALGRGLQRQDKCDVDLVLQYTKENSGSFRAMVKAIVLSNAFHESPAFLAQGNPTHAN